MAKKRSKSTKKEPHTCPSLESQLRNKINDIDARIEDLTEAKDNLEQAESSLMEIDPL